MNSKLLFQERIDLWDKYKKRHDEEMSNKVPEPITITLPDGKTINAESWKTTPYDLTAQKIR